MMGERKPIKKQRSRRKEGYLNRSPAICVVVHDLSGRPISDEIATKVVNAVFEVTEKERLAINFTRT